MDQPLKKHGASKFAADLADTFPKEQQLAGNDLRIPDDGSRLAPCPSTGNRGLPSQHPPSAIGPLPRQHPSSALGPLPRQHPPAGRVGRGSGRGGAISKRTSTRRLSRVLTPCRSRIPLRSIAMSLSLAFALPAMAQAQDGAEEAPSGLLQIIFSGGIVGAIMIFILLALSLTAAYLVFDHLMTIRRRDLMPEGLSDQVQQALLAGDINAARQACNARPSFLSFVLLHGIGELEFGWNSVEKAIEDALAEQSARLFRKIEYLSVIGNIAPMVGLLGTVIGMIIAFQEVAATQGMASAPQLARGIYQALITTVGGLIVAIPSIGAFAIFRNRIDQFVAEAAFMAQHVFAPLRRKAKRKGDG